MGAPDNSRAIPASAGLESIVLPLQGQIKTVTPNGQATNANLNASRGYAITISTPLMATVQIAYRTGGTQTVYVAPGTRRIVPARDFVSVLVNTASGSVSLWLEDVRTLGLCPP